MSFAKRNGTIKTHHYVDFVVHPRYINTAIFFIKKLGQCFWAIKLSKTNEWEKRRKKNEKWKKQNQNPFYMTFWDVILTNTWKTVSQALWKQQTKNFNMINNTSGNPEVNSMAKPSLLQSRKSIHVSLWQEHFRRNNWMEFIDTRRLEENSERIDNANMWTCTQMTPNYQLSQCFNLVTQTRRKHN